MFEREAATPKKRNPEKAVATMAWQAPQSLDELNRIIAASELLVPGAAQFGAHAGFITIHPSFLLRFPDPAAQMEAYCDFVRYLRAAKALAGG